MGTNQCILMPVHVELLGPGWVLLTEHRNFHFQNKEFKFLAIKSEGVKRNDCFSLKPFGKARALMVGAALGTCVPKYSRYFPSTEQ